MLTKLWMEVLGYFWCVVARASQKHFIMHVLPTSKILHGWLSATSQHTHTHERTTMKHTKKRATGCFEERKSCRFFLAIDVRSIETVRLCMAGKKN